MPVTMISAAAIGLVLLILSVRVSAVRRKAHVSMGDGGNAELLARIRAQANCAEYAPLALVLLLLAELHFGATAPVIASAVLLLSGRILHPVGMALPAPNAPRVIGTLATWLALLLLIALVGIAALAQEGA